MSVLSPAERRVLDALGSLFAREQRLVLAVSGGLDSMVLLDAASRTRPAGARVVVATFDHGTGAAAAAAADLVRRRATACGLPLEHAHAMHRGYTEAEWRRQRWAFLRDVADRHTGVVVTAHTLDDQLETVVMRILRHSGARGLAALFAQSVVQRPLLELSRSELAAYARQRDLVWVDDPSNASPAHLRNRVRHDLLPALRRANPALPAELLALALRAAELRASVDAIAATIVRLRSDQVVEVQLTDLLQGDEGSAVLLWQSIAAGIGVALDWRGTQRLTRFGTGERAGARIPLSGGYEAVRRSSSIVLRPRAKPSGGAVPLESSSATTYGVWRFRSVSDATINEATVADPWIAWLPADRALTVRAWQWGDRMLVNDDGARRRVKRFFADRHVVAPDRDGWPVVVMDDEIIWIPGIRRGPAATARSGRPALCFVCERVHS